MKWSRGRVPRPHAADAVRILVALLALLLLTAASPNPPPSLTNTLPTQPPPPAWVDDPLAPQQRHLHPIGAYDAWRVRRGEDAVVAVLDTGVDLDHPDLRARIIDGIDLIDPATPPDDPQGHGTIVAGIIAAVAGNGRGVVGVAPRARIVPVRVLRPDGSGDADTVATGIRWAVDAGVDVINLSLAEVQQGGAFVRLPLVADAAVRAAIEHAADAGVVVVAAAGNEGRRTTPYTADQPVLVVGATHEDDELWEDSNRDARTLFAPGVDILSTWTDARYARSDGTSFATPIVAAAAAMLAGAGMPAEEIRERLVDTAVDIGAGLGRVDVAAALQGVAPAPEPPPTPEPPEPPEPPSTAAALPVPAPAPAPAPPAATSEGPFEQVEVVEEDEAPTPAPPPSPAPPTAPLVTEAPPTIPAQANQAGTRPSVATVPSAQPRADLEPVEAVQAPIASESLATGIAVAGSEEDRRGAAVRVAGALLGADVIAAAWVLNRRRRSDPA